MKCNSNSLENLIISPFKTSRKGSVLIFENNDDKYLKELWEIYNELFDRTSMVIVAQANDTSSESINPSQTDVPQFLKSLVDVESPIELLVKN